MQPADAYRHNLCAIGAGRVLVNPDFIDVERLPPSGGGNSPCGRTKQLILAQPRCRWAAAKAVCGRALLYWSNQANAAVARMAEPPRVRGDEGACHDVGLRRR
jgi:hypothetical protein